MYESSLVMYIFVAAILITFIHSFIHFHSVDAYRITKSIWIWE